MSLSTAKLTEEQEEFFKLIMIRAVSERIGQPYIAYALLELIPINAPGLKTMGVDKYFRCYIDFDYMMEKGVKFASQVLNHEPWHLLRNHSIRFEGLDALPNGQRHNSFAWNMAGDLTINGDIPKLVPEDSLFPEKGMFAKYKLNTVTEDYYYQIMKDEQFNPPCPECGKKPGEKNDSKDKGKDKGDEGDSGDEGQDGDSGDNGDNGQGDGDGDGSGEGDGEGDNADGGAGNAHGKNGKGKPCSTCDGHGNKPGQGQGNGQAGQGSGMPDPHCGSGAGNKLEDYELGEGEAPAVDEERGDIIRKNVAEAIKQYARSNPGTVPGGAEIWADETLKVTPPDWRAILRGALKQAISWKRGQLDYNRTRRNRRQPNPRIITPALMSPRPRIAFAVDTSGSHLHKLGVVVDQAVEITKKVGVRDKELMAFGVDMVATNPKFVQNPHKVLDSMIGGGGTDMCVAFEVFSNLAKENKADIGLLLTDLQTDWPKEKPQGNMKYVVCGIVDSRQHWEMEWVARAEAAIGDWAEIVIIDVAEEA